MDNVTHALAGGLIAAAGVLLVERRSGRPASPGFGRAAAVLGVVAAELPDADLVYAGSALGMGKLGYLLHHRGHTHTVLFAVLAGLLVWALALRFRRGAAPPAERWALLGVTLAGTLSHLVLDFTNSYGVHPFWPVERSWYYGDAVFIIEPWLWIAALPALLLVYRRTGVRVLLGVALVGILAAAWSVDQVGRDVAVAMTVVAALWTPLLLRARPARAVALAAAAWLCVEATFFVASGVAREAVRATVGYTLRDVALNPAVGDPRCFRGLVVEVDGPTYRVTETVVATLPAVRDVRRCAGRRGEDASGERSRRAATSRVRWGREWSAPRAELVALAASNCRVAAALRFMRVPMWRVAPDGVIQLADLRYGEGGRGFADVVIPARPAACPAHVPGWTPPRQDVLGAG